MRSATLEHCHDFRALEALKRAIITHGVPTQRRDRKGWKSLFDVPYFTTFLTAILNKHEFVFRTFTTFTLAQVCQTLQKNLAKIDTEMLIPEGRKLPLKVVAKGKNFDNFSRAVKNIQLNDKVDLIFVFALLDLIFE